MGTSASTGVSSRRGWTRGSAREPAAFRIPIGWKFGGLLVVLVPSIVAISLIGSEALSGLKARLDRVYRDNLESTRTVGRIASAVGEAQILAHRLVIERDPATREQLRTDLRVHVAPGVEELLLRLESLSRDEPADLALGLELERSWETFLGYTSSSEFETARTRLAREEVSANVEQLGEAMSTVVDRVEQAEERQAERSRAAGRAAYARTVALFRSIVLLSLVVCIGATIWLIRNVVRRVAEYSSFAGTVAQGSANARVRPRGHDELTDLGWALNEMVARDEAARSYEESQSEFVEAMQVTQNEEEAHGLLKRHIERSVPESTVTVLNRNNSADRLEATTELGADDGLADRIAEAKPRDCLAVRLARSHSERAGTDPLIACSLCHPLDGSTHCSPLLVGGEVIGSVLVNRPDPFDELQGTRCRDSVTQAAPVLANLRNLAIAQLRAATDPLTGLPNARAVQDTMNRLVAQASRMVWPLSAVLLDLDHFKRINDTLGHSRGDEVLAAVGVALHSTVRDSDFVGRYGGEEFVMLLPNTDRDGAAVIAERVRKTVAEIDVLDDQRVTVSLGVAMFPEDAPDASRLFRSADRALYRAKANGRNRVEFFSSEDPIQEREQTHDVARQSDLELEREG